MPGPWPPEFEVAGVCSWTASRADGADGGKEAMFDSCRDFDALRGLVEGRAPRPGSVDWIEAAGAKTGSDTAAFGLEAVERGSAPDARRSACILAGDAREDAPRLARTSPATMNARRRETATASPTPSP